jgi:hypothetical protein
VPFSRREVDLRHPPADLDALIDWFERFSYELVLLEDFSLAEIRSVIDVLEAGVRGHLESSSRRRGELSDPRSAGDLETILASDHEWFRTSLSQLEWFYAVVAHDDHGGNRQALGQYGRILAESLRRHRRDERTPPAGREEIWAGTSAEPSPSNAK